MLTHLIHGLCKVVMWLRANMAQKLWIRNMFGLNIAIYSIQSLQFTFINLVQFNSISVQIYLFNSEWCVNT